MRFAVPLSDSGELDLLKDAGCDEIYVGLLENEWRCLYGGHDTVSRRQGAANLGTREELWSVLQSAGRRNVPVYLALNARYTPPQYPYLLSLCEQFASRGGTGVILQDMGLLLRLRECALPPSFRITASLLLITVNADGVRLLRRLGVTRIVLPRFLTISEMKRIAREEPDMEYEAMGMGDQCPMIDGLCRSFHGETSIPEHLKQSGLPFQTFDPSFSAHHLCIGMPRKAHPCAACEMDSLEKAGIQILKFGGRGTDLASRIRDIRFFARAREQKDQGAIRRLYQNTYRHECHCYYQ